MAHHKNLAMTIFAFALVGCASQDAAAPEQPTSEASISSTPYRTSAASHTTEATASQAAASASVSSAPADEQSATLQPTANSTSEFPATATEVKSVHDVSGVRIATIVAPSGNIGCDIVEGQGIGCGVISLSEKSSPEPDQIIMPGWYFFTPAEGQTYDTGRSEAAEFMLNQDSQVVPYGTSVYFDRYVCESEEAGLQCSNIDTGHGMFLNRDEIKTF